jgi:hypothetical protein
LRERDVHALGEMKDERSVLEINGSMKELERRERERRRFTKLNHQMKAE